MIISFMVKIIILYYIKEKSDFDLNEIIRLIIGWFEFRLFDLEFNFIIKCFF